MIPIHGRSAPESITTLLARPQQFAIGMRAMMLIALRPLSHHRRRHRRHPLILKDAVMAMDRMPLSATVWMSGHVLELQIASGWRPMIPRNANRPRPPHRQHPLMVRGAVPDILRELSLSAMPSMMAMTAKPPECARGSRPMIPMSVNHRPPPRHHQRLPSIRLDVVLAIPPELGHSAQESMRC
jgi:hypothetical protein